MANKLQYAFSLRAADRSCPLDTESEYEAYSELFKAALFRPEGYWELNHHTNLNRDGARIAYAQRSEDRHSVTLTIVSNR